MSDQNQIELREYIERILDEREKALNLTAKSLDHRLEHLNALREEVTRDRVSFVPRELFNAMVQRIEKLEMWQSRIIGVSSVLVIVAGILGATLTHLLSK